MLCVGLGIRVGYNYKSVHALYNLEDVTIDCIYTAAHHTHTNLQKLNQKLWYGSSKTTWMQLRKTLGSMGLRWTDLRQTWVQKA